MITNTSNVILLIYFFLMGACPAIFYGIASFFISPNKNIFLIRYFISPFTIILSSIMFLFHVNLLNFGQIRFYLLLAFVLGFYIERKTIGKLFALLYTKVYNLNAKIMVKFKSSNFGKRILK